ncbi:hypothetical protein NDU88_000700 [Pleurodeles waltl]|uniref:Uncharacterized protein n=1 Tax=Pleurodeles waltl TaxID=8319 RepID=A0AAV7KMR4_PLEWA|nr:hypothetical protein NDU88_000700 [Pleurodeles waltl]
MSQGGACPRWRSAKTCPPALLRLDPQKRLAARLGEAWRLPPNREAPPGVPCRSAAAGSGLRRSRVERGGRPRSRGGAAERREGQPGPRDRLFPGGPVERGAEGSGGLGAHSGPWNNWTALWASAPLRRSALKERGAPSYATGLGAQAGALHLGTYEGGLVELRGPDRS